MSPLRCAFFVGLWALMPPAARADEPLPRPQSAAPADLYTVSQSRPPEGFSLGAGVVTQVLGLPSVQQPQGQYRLGHDLLVTGSLAGYVQLDVALPLRLVIDDRLHGTLGGLRLRAKFALPRLRRDLSGIGLGVALVMGVDAPTQVPGARQTVLRPGAVVDWRFAWARGFDLLLAGQLGATLPLGAAGQLTSAALPYGVAVQARIIPAWQVSLLAGVDGSVPLWPTLSAGTANFFGGIKWFGERCYSVSAQGGVRLGEPQGLGWFAGVSFAKVWGGECAAHREEIAEGDGVVISRRAPEQQHHAIEPFDVIAPTPNRGAVTRVAFTTPDNHPGDACPQEIRHAPGTTSPAALQAAWQDLLAAAEIGPGLLQVVTEVSPALAQRSVRALLQAPLRLGSYGPRRAALYLLQGIIAGQTPVPRLKLGRAAGQFKQIVLVRPDGYLVHAFSGRPIERLGPVTIQGDGARAGDLELGAFYFRAFGQLYRVDAELRCRDGIVHEIALQHGLGNAALDGVEDTLSALVLGIGQLIRHPIRSLAGLRELPGALVQLIRNSPEYWERFAAMSRTDQIRESSRILSQLLLLYGTANGLTVQLGRAAEALGSLTIPTLRLSGTGELIFATVSVQAGQAATALSGAPGAVYILHMANVAAGGGGGQSAGGSSGGGSGQSASGSTAVAAKTGTMNGGRAFNGVRRFDYLYREVVIEQPGGTRVVLDAYDPRFGGEIVSRKLTQLAQVQKQTALNYLRELARKYKPGYTIANVPSSGPLAGSKLIGHQILEVPVQLKPIPQAVLNLARQLNILIRDVAGKVY